MLYHFPDSELVIKNNNNTYWYNILCLIWETCGLPG